MVPRNNWVIRTAMMLTIFQFGLCIQSKADTLPKSSYFPDLRKKLDLQPSSANFKTSNLSKKAIVELYLRSHHKEYGLDKNLSQLFLERTSKSLYGTHFRFRQHIKGKVIADSSLSVSISNDKRIYRIYNNLKNIQFQELRPKTMLTKDEAYDRLWQALHVEGDLIHKPKATLQYMVTRGRPHPIYDIELPVTKPYGFWRARVDAITGEIHQIYDNRVDLTKNNPKKNVLKRRTQGPIRNRFQAFTDFEKQNNAQSTKTLLIRKNGTAQIFDPDPRTTLDNPSLEDNSNDSDFKGAYTQKPLIDITFDGQVHSLTGPWITIEDFDSPRVPPVTSNTGEWLFKRGEAGFNDAMTYYHIDQSQRYLQSLGYTRDRGIQYGPIRVDANGANGADNSYFQPSTNSLSFGHGCVDDNEDADVILHEYGHAIQHSINDSWRGGDTGAIGEGFGDYWAGSYSIGNTQGAAFFPNNVFTWDGHSQSGSCWPGRILNATELQYDPNRTYGAHASLPGGRSTDELWSTPIFQSLKDLINMGVSRAEVDQIIIESHFGLGGDITMRELANSTLQAARLLFPSGPHAEVFAANFSRQNIIELPHVEFKIEAKILQSGSDSTPEPGEDAIIAINLKNTGNLTAEDITAEASTNTAGVSIPSKELRFEDLSPNQSADGEAPLNVRIGDDVECGKDIKLNLAISYNQKKIDTPLHIKTGKPVGARSEITPEMPIPDNKPDGLQIPIQLQGGEFQVTKSFRVTIDIAHSYIGDLEVSLEAPSGKTVSLHKRRGGSRDNIKGVYPDTLKPETDFKSLIGEPLNGTWIVRISDHASLDTGVLKSLSIEDILGFKCNSPN